MNLYEIDNAITEAFEQAIDPETGEICNEEAYEALNSLEIQREGKIEGVLLWIKNLRAESEALKAEKIAFDARQRQAERKAESLKKYISGILGGEKFKTDRVAVSWRKTESVTYDGNVRDLPTECIREKEPEVNKTELKKLLKAGEKISGAQIVESMSMQIK